MKKVYVGILLELEKFQQANVLSVSSVTPTLGDGENYIGGSDVIGVGIIGELE